MTVKIGGITIGQAPRMDVVHDILPILGDNIELLQSGALDDLSVEDINNFSTIGPDDYVLVSKMRDGTEVKFAERHVLPLLQNCIDKLEQQGVSAILFLCTGDFDDTLHSRVPLIFPNKIISALVPVLAPHSKIATLTPSPAQLEQSKQKWSKFVQSVTPIAASPYKDSELEIDKAAAIVRDLDVDLVVMDCIGYSEQMKASLHKQTGKNILLSRTLIARVIKELVD